MSMWIAEHNPIRFFLAPHGSHACPDWHSRLRRWHAVDHLILRLVHQWRGWWQYSSWKIIYQLSHLNVRRIKLLWWNHVSSFDSFLEHFKCILFGKIQSWVAKMWFKCETHRWFSYFNAFYQKMIQPKRLKRWKSAIPRYTSEQWHKLEHLNN